VWSGRDEGGSDENKEGQSPFGLCYKPFTRNGKDAQRTSEDDNHFLASSPHSATLYKPSTRGGQDGEKNR